MTLLVTGAQGFVMSNLVRAWLRRHPSERVVALDFAPPDTLARRWFSAEADRITWLQADILAREAWFGPARDAGVDLIVHGAAVTPHSWVDEAGVRHGPEREQPERVLDVNLGGTRAALELARTLPDFRRFVLVSTGSVYGDEGPADRPLPEVGYVDPTTLYGISKYAAEMVARRYGELFGLGVVAARLSSVYGPMDRVLPSRHVVCAPNRITGLALAGTTIRLNSAHGVGDYIQAADVATALIALLETSQPRHPVYNVASGEVRTLGQLAELTCQLVPGAAWRVDPAEPNASADPTRRLGQWGAYDISRLHDELGWRPEPMERRLAEYLDWRRAEEATA